MTDETLAPLVKTVVVPLDRARAFELFTTGFAEWWPLATHSVGLHDAVDVSFPARVGGEIVETRKDGATSTWGTVTEWDPPAGVRFTWHPGQGDSMAGDVEVRFVLDTDDRTVVTLTHSGWDRRPNGAEARRSYDSGWEPVLEAYKANA